LSIKHIAVAGDAVVITYDLLQTAAVQIEARIRFGKG